MSNLSCAARSLELVRHLQSLFVHGLEQVARDYGESVLFEKVEWLRDEGLHGGGDRFFSFNNAVFNRASVNVSHIHYENLPDKALASATALSTIIHPQSPYAPSVHMHFSWTEMRNGKGYWRVMADLNPSVVFEEDKSAFESTLMEAAPELFEEAKKQGEKYFYIPELGRHRGVIHFYLEGFNTGDFDKDLQLTQTVGEKAMQAYLSILQNALQTRQESIESDRKVQLAYHTLYFFQVLTLDRGTTSGLLVHDQNDLGIMGSLPARVSKKLLASWGAEMTKPQDDLLDALLECLPENGEVNDVVRLLLASTVREHYQKYPRALNMQASGNVVPPTVQNHR